MSLLILCPTRSRPWSVLEAYQSFQDTAELPGSQFLAVVDEDDPTLASYQHLDIPLEVQPRRGGMVAQLNASALLHVDDFDFLGFVGDDHRFRTNGWDKAFSYTLNAHGGGLAYGNDLFWPHGEIPTQIVMSSEIIRALGWMALPSCIHLYVDNVWKELGDGVDRLFYFPRYIIEHMHPAGGKAEWDDQYRQVNSDERYAADRAAFETWKANQASEDIERVRRAISRQSVPDGDHLERGTSSSE